MVEVINKSISMRKFSLYFCIVLFGCSNNYEYEYHNNGQLKNKYELKNGKKEGLVFEYDSLSNIISETTWKEGQLHGVGLYYSDGLLVTRSNWGKGKLNGTYVEFYDNEVEKVKGNYKHGLPFGDFFFYEKTGSLKAVREYLIIDDSSYLNQVIVFDQQNDTIFSESNFYRIQHKNSLALGETLNVSINLKAPYFKDSKIYVFIDQPEDSLKYRRLMADQLFLNFSYIPKKIGDQKIDGFIDEVSINKNMDDSIEGASRRLYFSTNYFVKNNR